MEIFFNRPRGAIIHTTGVREREFPPRGVFFYHKENDDEKKHIGSGDAETLKKMKILIVHEADGIREAIEFSIPDKVQSVSVETFKEALEVCRNKKERFNVMLYQHVSLRDDDNGIPFLNELLRINPGMVMEVVMLEYLLSWRFDLAKYEKLKKENEAKPKILLLHADIALVELDIFGMLNAGYRVEYETTAQKALELCGKEKFDIVFVHFRPRDEEVLERVKKIRESQPDAIIHLMSHNSKGELLRTPGASLPEELVSNFVTLKPGRPLVDVVYKDEKLIRARTKGK